jgi:hypothetical protein
MATASLIGAGVAIAGAVVAAVWLPARAGSPDHGEPVTDPIAAIGGEAVAA